jgi:hypothetical protein
MGEFDPNTSYNENRYTPEQWEQVRHSMHVRVWGVRVMHVADVAGRTQYKSRVMRWLYDRDLISLAIPAVGLVICVMVMTVVGYVALR